MSDAQFMANSLLAGLFRRQAAVLVALLVMAFAGYQTLEWTVSFLSDDGALINVAGRQRMLSQRIIGLGYQLSTATDEDAGQTFRSLIAIAATEMENGHARLIQESTERGMSPELHALYFGQTPSLDQSVLHFIALARDLAGRGRLGTGTDTPILRELAQMGRVELLQGLERVVIRYQEESRARVVRLHDNAMIGLYLFAAVLAFSWLGVFHPMARRLRQELAAHQAVEEQIHLVLESVGEGIIGLDASGHTSFVNRAATRMLGYEADELIGRHLHPMVHHTRFDGSTYPQETCPLAQTLRDGRRCSVDNELFWRKDGTSFPIHYLSNPILKDGALIGAVVTFRDISEQLETKRSLQASEEIKSSILDAALDAIITVDCNGLIAEFNPAAERIFGHRTADAIGHEIADLIIPEEFRDAHRRGLARVVVGGASKVVGQRLEMTGQHADGHTIPVELTITHLPDHGLFTAFIRDLSEQKRTEAALRRSQKLDAVGQLTGGIAHDFNNLLGIITGNLELLQKSVADDEKAAKRVATALKSAKRGADLTRRLLSFSRQDPGIHGKEPCDLNEAISSMLEMLQRSLTQVVTVKTGLEPNLWKTAINRSEFEDSLLNLTINARDAMPQGGILLIDTGNITIEPAHARIDPNPKAGDYVVVSVSDTGTGISREIVDKIFEPFFTTKERGKGTGLGLSMVYGFAKRSGGHIRAYSDVGVGTTFRLYLPRCRDEAGMGAGQDDSLGDLPRGSETVLVVDDEIHLAEIAGEFLQDLGYAVIVCGDPREASRLLGQRSDIDLLFTDVVMPNGMDGFALARQVREQGLGCAVLFTSGFTGYAHDRPLDEGHVMLTKPYGKADLARKVRDVLETRKQEVKRP